MKNGTKPQTKIHTTTQPSAPQKPGVGRCTFFGGAASSWGDSMEARTSGEKRTLLSLRVEFTTTTLSRRAEPTGFDETGIAATALSPPVRQSREDSALL